MKETDDKQIHGKSLLKLYKKFYNILHLRKNMEYKIQIDFF